MSFLGTTLASWGFNRQVNELKKEFNDTFGNNNQEQSNYYLDDQPDVQYNKDDHQSWTAKRAEQAKEKSMKNVKSDAVRQAMERRAAAQAAAAAKNRKR